MRVKSVISYDGSKFYGFQCQKSTDNTVTATIYRALQKLGISSKVVGSGRTDRGVHATGQVIHFDLPPFWSDLEKLHTMLNRHLHPAIHVRRILPVDENFHARYSAKRRAYRYILTKRTFSPFLAPYVTFFDYNEELISHAIKLFEGTHDFQFFMKTGSDVKTSVRTIYKATTYTYGDFFVLYFEANGFLRAQVRMMVEFLLQISQDNFTIYHLKEQLEGQARYLTTLAPPNGLYLTRVIY